MNKFLNNKFKLNTININNHNTKINKSCKSLYNQEVLDILKNEREAIFKHKQWMINYYNELDNVLAELLLYRLHK